MSRANDQRKLQEAFSLHQKGNLSEAANLYRQLIKMDPTNFYALHFLGVIESGAGKIEQARLLMERSLSIQPPNISFIENYATLLFLTGDYKSAIQVCQQGLQLNKKSLSLLYVIAISLLKLNQLQDSLRQFDALLFLEPTHIAGINERGSVLAELKRYDSALASFEKALSLNPEYAEAHLNKGNLYGTIKRYDEALSAYDKALKLKPDLADAWLGRGNVFFNFKRYDDAFAAYDKALELKTDLAGAWLGRGNVYYDLKRHDEAFAAYHKALSLKPDFSDAWLGRGNVFFERKRYDEALSAYDKALSLKPDLAEAWLGRGNVFYDLKRYDEALVAYDKALSLKPDLVGTEGARLRTKMLICNWIDFDTECAHLASSVKNKKVNIDPFAFLGISSSPDDQLQCAKLWVAEKYPPSQKPIWRGEHYRHDRIRVAYVSADFHEHPVSFLITGFLESHDKSRFDVTAISLGFDVNSEMHQRLKASFDRFIDAKTYNDEQIANLVRSLEVDILIDLMGFTAGSRTGAFARRPAPIQVNYLGYAGTMGAQYIDYILADRFVIPEEKRECYSEKVVYLPNSFMGNDSKRRISERLLHRSEYNLPETGFVFCSFNLGYKITPQVFDIWMRLLRQLDNSVLWLSNTNETAIRNLRREAQNRGVDPSRLVFTQRVPLNEDHLARHRLANLFLDTLPYNAHTSASDALWAGLPVLTCLGATFAGRVAASLLNAIRLPELITTTPEAYEQMAIDLATHPEKLEVIKRKLAENRLTTPLFDTKLFTKHIEAAYTTMYERYQAGLVPGHIIITN